MIGPTAGRLPYHRRQDGGRVNQSTSSNDRSKHLEHHVHPSLSVLWKYNRRVSHAIIAFIEANSKLERDPEERRRRMDSGRPNSFRAHGRRDRLAVSRRRESRRGTQRGGGPSQLQMTLSDYSEEPLSGQPFLLATICSCSTQSLAPSGASISPRFKGLESTW